MPLDDEDDAFDRHYPRSLGMKSSIHFTPVAVARRAARMLTPQPGMRVLDVGAGAGKFCVVAAQEVPSCTFVGIELRPHLVHMAKKVAARLAVDNATFLEGNALDLDWSAYDAFYFYNPFGEQILEAGFVLDDTLLFDRYKYLEYVRGARKRLAMASIGTRVVTYHTFGATAPLGYDLVERLPIGTDSLELWVKTREVALDPDQPFS